MKIGVLALQGDFAEHLTLLQSLDITAIAVRLPQDLRGLDGLIIPGGESTTIYKLLERWKLIEPIKKQVAAGMAIWGTCAGAIILAQLGLMDIEVTRNAFGRQIDSFVIEIKWPLLGQEPFSAVFIRAPIINKVGPKAKVLLALRDGTIVAAKQGKLLATSFHPELTHDTRFLQYFINLVKKQQK